jgi:hypothetical protein
MPVDAPDPFFREIAKTLAFGATFASIPLFASMGDLQPPWPTAVAYVSAALILLGALLARELGRGMTERRRKTMLLLAALLTVLGLFAYLYLYSQLVVPLDNGSRIIRGFACNADALATYPDECPYLTKDDLKRAGYQADLMYTAGSLTAAKLLLVASWLLFTAGLVAAVGWAVARTHAATEQDPNRRPPADAHQ